MVLCVRNLHKERCLKRKAPCGGGLEVWIKFSAYIKSIVVVGCSNLVAPGCSFVRGAKEGVVREHQAGRVGRYIKLSNSTVHAYSHHFV